MNTIRIAQAARDIEENQNALKWLTEYGGALKKDRVDAFSIDVRLFYAKACVGAMEAEHILTLFAKFEIEHIVEASIRNCVNTIELAKSAIREEVMKEG